MNKCDIGQLEVHDVEVCPLYYQLVPGRLVRSKKRSEALSVAVSTNVGFSAKKFGRVHSPRKDGSGFLCFVRRKYVCQGSKFILGFRSTCATRCKLLGALPKF